MPKKNTSPAEYPQAVLQQIERLGQHIAAIAHKRRGENAGPIDATAGRLLNPPWPRIEQGVTRLWPPAHYAMCMWLVDPAILQQ